MVAKVATSKHLRTSTELTLVAPIRAEFALTAAHDSVAMATRLGALLQVFFELRRAASERWLDDGAGPLERLRALHSFSWSVFDNGQKLLLAVTFDRPWQPYIRAVVDLAGPFLDAIFCHCEGYEHSSTDQGYVPFADWVRRHQIEVSLFYAAEPDLTVDDQRYLRALERLQRGAAAEPRLEQRLATLAVGEPGGGASERLARGAEPHPKPLEDRRLARAAAALVSLRQMFHAPPGDAAAARARGFFDRAAWLMLEPLVGGARDPSARLPAPLARALREMRDAGEVACEATRQASRRAAPALDEERERLEREVQGNILTPYPRTTHGCAALLGFEDAAAAQAFVGRMATEVTAHGAAAGPGTKVNVALTFEGFRTLGLTDEELASFPIEFRQGMAARAGSLGDLGPEHPDSWSGPRRNGIDAEPGRPLASLDEVDMLLLLQLELEVGELDWGPDHPLHAQLTRVLGAARGVRVVSVLPLQRELAERAPGANTFKERFGYADGISQPVPAPWARDEPAADRVALGELLIGHAGDRGEPERYPAGPELYTRDGSFLVVRQLEQDVEAFEAFIDENAGSFAGGREALYTKLMGRQRDGWSPVSPGSLNAFDYSRDPAGEHCPLISHVRRSNPRTPPGESVHGRPLRGPRIARRGFSYGPFCGSTAAGPRGLLFMAYNASLAEQFEVIQRWLNGANSTGLLSSHADPIVSHREGQVITLLDGREPRHLLKKKPFVKLVWGAYFFAPSKAALAALSRLAASRAERDARACQARAAQGEALVEPLLALDELAPDKARFGWKRLLEDRLAPGAREATRAAWTFIRERHGGVLPTPYGVLVGTAEHARRVLGDEACFSVSEYGRRMQETVGLLHLGMDRCPLERDARERAAAPPRGVGYAAAAALPNELMAGITREQGLLATLGVAARHLDRLGQDVELSELAKGVVAEVARGWFGLPRDRAGYDIHHAAALAIFQPNPERAVHEAARALGAGLEAAKAEALLSEAPLARSLAERGYRGELALALVGAAQGMLAATVGSVLSVATSWLENGRSARLAAWLATADGQAWRSDPAARARAGEGAPILRELLAALCARPAPELLHRTVVAETALGGVRLRPGERVVISLGSALASEAGEPGQLRALLFGGDYPSQGQLAPKHPCPGREAALGVMLGLLVTLLENDVRAAGGLWVSRRG